MIIKKYEDILSVKLVSYTRPSEEFNHLNSNEFGSCITNLISYCARVSSPSNQNNLETSEKLIKYLVRNRHWSPFEMVNVCLEVTSTRDIVRQILRHRSFSFQEFSQRYGDPTKDLEFCIREARIQDPVNRQNSMNTNDDNMNSWWIGRQLKLIMDAQETYKAAIELGIAKEVARCVLPEGNTVSRVYINGSIRSWIHYIDVREKNGTQKEHMLVANRCAEVITNIFPNIRPESKTKA